jgi:outer membrane protein assembly factor BamB
MKKPLLFITLLLPIFLLSQTVNQFRGNARDGKYPDKNLLALWPADGPALLWENKDMGNGYGSPAVMEETIYINGETDSIGYLYALDKKGNQIWKSSYGREWIYTFPGSRSTPTVVNDLIYVTSGLGNLFCFNRADGSKKWSVNMRKELHGRYTYHGHAESPLVYDDKVILVPGGMDTNVVALNRFTGSILWICKGFHETPGYNSPILIELPSRKLIVTFTAYHMLGIDAMTGKLLWSHEQVNTPMAERKSGVGDTHSNCALFEDGFIYYVAGDGNCAVKLKLSEDGSNVEQVWRNPEVDDYMGQFIKLGNRLYTGSDAKKALLALDASTGQIVDSLKVGCGAILWADNLLYYYNQRGEMKLVDPNIPMKAISSFKIKSGTKEHFSIPVISEGILYIRHGKSLVAYKIKA